MKKLKSLRLILLLALFVSLNQACKTLQNSSTKNDKDLTSSFFVFQDGKEIQIDKYIETVETKRADFALRFYNKRYNPEEKEFYSAQIAAFLDESELEKIDLGVLKSDLASFEPGSGMAPAISGKYEMLLFKKGAHHYTFYENSDSKRLNLIDESKGLLKLEFEIASLYYNGREVEMAETNLEEFYLALIVDRNLNGIIDKGELLKLTVTLK